MDYNFEGYTIQTFDHETAYNLITDAALHIYEAPIDTKYHSYILDFSNISGWLDKVDIQYVHSDIKPNDYLEYSNKNLTIYLTELTKPLSIDDLKQLIISSLGSAFIRFIGIDKEFYKFSDFIINIADGGKIIGAKIENEDEAFILINALLMQMSYKHKVSIAESLFFEYASNFKKYADEYKGRRDDYPSKLISCIDNACYVTSMLKQINCDIKAEYNKKYWKTVMTMYNLRMTYDKLAAYIYHNYQYIRHQANDVYNYNATLYGVFAKQDKIDEEYRKNRNQYLRNRFHWR